MYDRFSGFQEILIQWNKYWKYDVTFASAADLLHRVLK